MKLRILVAEDNEMGRLPLRIMLGKLGYECEIVNDGEAAVQAVKTIGYDIVFMDVQMPIMDGLAASRKINEEISTEKRPTIIALCGYDVPGMRMDCKNAGMSCLIFSLTVFSSI
ncbi:MAG: response regulator, partial [Pseudomonadota bacterium]